MPSYILNSLSDTRKIAKTLAASLPRPVFDSDSSAMSSTLSSDPEGSSEPNGTLFEPEPQSRGQTRGAVVALVGQLGAGKTTFVQELARALGATALPSSPTFVWLKTYPLTRGPYRALHHIDCYRTSGLDAELADTIGACQDDPSALTAIEWADKIRPHISATATWIRFEVLAPDRRRLTITSSR